MNSDENGHIDPNDNEVVLPQAGEIDPIDQIENVEDLRKVAKANRAMASRYKNKPARVVEIEKPAETITTQSPPASTVTLNDEVVDLRLDGYSKQEVEFILRNGGRKSLEDANSFVSIAINTQREQRQAEQAASQVADTSGQSEIERKYTPEQLRNMSVKELETLLPRNS
jgi:hypothetical protein